MEEPLFEAANRGDRRAQQEIARLLRSFAQILCRSGGPPGAPDLDWEDVAQEASRKLFSAGLAQYRGHGSEKSYVYSIVKSTMIQMARSGARRRRREEIAAADRPSQANDHTARLQVTRLLERLSPECSELIERVFLAEERYADLARELGLEESSVRAKLSRCLRTARELAATPGTRTR